ncbi:MAG TPA: hypothetical protein VEL31_24550 [Ktedonobacteraceae bacterium]|nr:hypothetical protein [Ktedonobacteraceae bacterium]
MLPAKRAAHTSDLMHHHHLPSAMTSPTVGELILVDELASAPSYSSLNIGPNGST